MSDIQYDPACVDCRRARDAGGRETVSEKDWAHFPCHQDMPPDEHGVVWTQPRCRCGWVRKALYQRDELLVHAYSVHLNAIHLCSENRQAISLAEKAVAGARPRLPRREVRK